MCTFGCRADEDCNANQACISNKCIDPCEATPCGPNAKCTVFNQRATCSCPAGFIPNPTAKVACLRSPGSACQANRDCATGTACMGGTCTPVCSTDLNCLSNERCDQAGICKSLCRRDEDCRSGEICEGLVCAIGCRADVECQENYACINNQCQGTRVRVRDDYIHFFYLILPGFTAIFAFVFSDPCSLPDACGVNAKCSNVNHQKLCACPAPLGGDPLIGCKQAFLPCSTELDCPTGQTCYGRSCYATCRR